MGGEHFAKHNPTKVVRCCAASLRFNRSVHVCYNMNVAGFLYQIRLLRVRFPFPVPVLLNASRFRLRVVSASASPPKNLSPFPVPVPRVPAVYGFKYSKPPPASLLRPSPLRGASAADAAGHLARLQRTSRAKVQRILIIANFKCTNLHIFVKKVISY